VGNGSRENTKIIGDLGETIACKFLESKGFTILDRNYRKKYGEIDIIARKGNSIRFVEVKSISRENSDFRPEEQAHPKKIGKIARVADFYMNQREGQEEYQIDVIGVFIDENRMKARCRFFEGVA